MPTYEYLCPEGHAFELFQKMSEKPRAKCPVCGKAAVRKISAGAGLVFKGSGFYITDYGKDGKKDQPAARAKTRGEGSGEAAPSSGDTGTTGDAKPGSDAKPAAGKS